MQECVRSFSHLGARDARTGLFLFFEECSIVKCLIMNIHFLCNYEKYAMPRLVQINMSYIFMCTYLQLEFWQQNTFVFHVDLSHPYYSKCEMRTNIDRMCFFFQFSFTDWITISYCFKVFDNLMKYIPYYLRGNTRMHNQDFPAILFLYVAYLDLVRKSFFAFQTCWVFKKWKLVHLSFWSMSGIHLLLFF